MVLVVLALWSSSWVCRGFGWVEMWGRKRVGERGCIVAAALVAGNDSTKAVSMLTFAGGVLAGMPGKSGLTLCCHVRPDMVWLPL